MTITLELIYLPIAITIIFLIVMVLHLKNSQAGIMHGGVFAFAWLIPILFAWLGYFMYAYFTK